MRVNQRGAPSGTVAHVNIYLLVLPAGSTTEPPDFADKRIPRHLKLNPTTWALASELATSAEVGEALGFPGGDNQHDRTWVIFKLVEDGYFGYAVSSLWQKLAAWEAEE